MMALDLVLQNFTTWNWLNIFIAVLFGVAPTWVLLRHYRRTQSLDYVIMAGIFVCWGINIFPIFLFIPPNTQERLIINLIWGILFMNGFFLVYVHSIRLRWTWRQKPQILWYICLTGLLVWYMLAGLDLIFPFLHDNEVFRIMNILLQEGYRFGASALVLFVYFFEPLIQPTTRTKTVKKLAQFVGVMGMIQGASSISLNVIAYMLQNSSLLPINRLIWYITAFFQGIALTTIAISFPESMLISHTQVLKAIKLYQQVQQMQPTEIMEQDALTKYLQAIPPEIFKIDE